MVYKTLNTKFGTAKLHKNGYYVISSGKEGNHSKPLHRLIFEDFYGEIPEGCVIHHKDGNKTNNCILNLQILSHSNHNSLHMTGERNPYYGKSLSEEHKRKLSEAHSGENNYWYGKHLSEEHKRKLSESCKGKIVSEESRRKMSESTKGEKNPMYGKTHSAEARQKISEAWKGRHHSLETKQKMSKSKNSTGYYRVSKKPCSSCKQGFTWSYKYYLDNGKQKTISSTDIRALEKKVKALDLEWYKLDENEVTIEL